jgi:hypothetical protein
MKLARLNFGFLLILASLPAWLASGARGQSKPTQSNLIHAGNLTVEVFDDGSYALRSTAIPGDVLRTEVEADTVKGTFKSSLYPRHLKSIAAFDDELGSGHLLTVTHTGLPGTPDLVCEFRVYDDQPWGDIRVSISNTTGSPIEMHEIRVVKISKGDIVQLNGPASADRVLSDDYSESPVQLMNLGEPKNGIHLGFQSQLIYNQKSGQSLFLGALSEDKLLTGFHLLSTVGPDAHMLSYEVADTGTDAVKDGTHYPSGNVLPFSLQAPAGTSISSERLMFAIGSDYHAQLENYGRAIRILHKALVTTPTPIGWWSWTAFYYGVSQNAVLTNAAWLKQNLGPLGYKYCFIDEGYQYARGEYATPDAYLFPQGVGYVGHQVDNEGLTFGLWVAPFEVSERSWVYEHHKEWLVHNQSGELIHIGKVHGKDSDDLYALDTTHPGAQEYLHSTYSTLTKDWGTGLIKMDFMDTAAVEGVRYRPNTTALEALRIGLEIIRSTVGKDVILDKDGSYMLTPVGLVNTGRIGQDTGHTFSSTHDAAPGIAARYYMNRNFYVSDPDAFTVSKQTIGDRGWHRNTVPLTLEEAEDSIALSAISGGMFEIGDDLPTLGASPERVALVKNSDLLDMAKLGRASFPFDLMTYRAEDKQPSIFLLKETPRQQILTVFNWTEEPRSHTLGLADLGLKASGSYTATDVLRNGAVPVENGALTFTLPPHSVRMLKLIDGSVPELAPVFEAHAPAAGQAGATVEFHAAADNADAPALLYHWDFGDGVSADGADVSHAYTYASQFTMTATATGLNGHTSQKTLGISITGTVPEGYRPDLKTRYSEPK